ncbi:hypothetical protein WA588_004669, partial [Blastocystis sp. NMH]
MIDDRLSNPRGVPFPHIQLKRDDSVLSSMEQPLAQFADLHDKRYKQYPLCLFEMYKEKMQNDPIFKICDPVFDSLKWLIRKGYVIFYDMQVVNLQNGQRNYLCIRLCVTFNYLNKQLFVPLILQIYPYNMYNSPPSIMLITDKEHQRNKSATYVDESDCIYTGYMKQWETDSSFDGGLQGLILNLRTKFSEVNPYE